MYPPGRAKALISSDSITLKLKGIRESELRTIRCPSLFTYSVITRSLTSLLCISISCARACPSSSSFSKEYILASLPMPRSAIWLMSYFDGKLCFTWDFEMISVESLRFAFESGGGLASCAVTPPNHKNGMRKRTTRRVSAPTVLQIKDLRFRSSAPSEEDRYILHLRSLSVELRSLSL